MKRQAIDVAAGDDIRVPDRRGARWRRVLRVYRRRTDRRVMVVLRTDAEFRRLGLPPRLRLPLAFLESFGVGVRRR